MTDLHHHRHQKSFAYETFLEGKRKPSKINESFNSLRLVKCREELYHMITFRKLFAHLRKTDTKIYVVKYFINEIEG